MKVPGKRGSGSSKSRTYAYFEFAIVDGFCALDLLDYEPGKSRVEMMRTVSNECHAALQALLSTSLDCLDTARTLGFPHPSSYKAFRKFRRVRELSISIFCRKELLPAEEKENVVSSRHSSLDFA